MSDHPEPVPPTEADIAHYHQRVAKAKRQGQQRIWVLPSYHLLNTRGGFSDDVCNND